MTHVLYKAISFKRIMPNTLSSCIHLLHLDCLQNACIYKYGLLLLLLLCEYTLETIYSHLIVAVIVMYDFLPRLV